MSAAAIAQARRARRRAKATEADARKLPLRISVREAEA
jgi:hypothetical protein